MEKDKTQWWSIGKAAKYLGVSRDTLRRWEKKGKIKPPRSPSGHRYYNQKLLDEVMTNKTQKIKTKIRKKTDKKEFIKLAAIALGALLLTTAIGLLLFF